jgi:hypothetical protein
MSERPYSPGLAVRLLIAAAVLCLIFGGGVLVGWATRERRPLATEKSAASIPAAEVKKELAACRREVRARAKARLTQPAAPPPGEMDDAGLERAAKLDALQKEVGQCRVRKTLLNAYVCGTIGDHIGLYGVLVNGTPCVAPPGIREYFVKSIDKCAEFEDFPAHLDKDELTQEEEYRIVQAIWRRAAEVRNKNHMADWEEGIRRDCRRIWALPDE